MSKLEIVILGHLNLNKMHGYKILQKSEMRHLNIWANLKKSSLYKVLGRLEKKNIISAKKEPNENLPTRKVYSITQQGKIYFRKIIEDFLKQSVECKNRDFSVGISFSYKLVTKSFFQNLVKKRIDFLEESKLLIPKHLEKCEAPKFFVSEIMQSNITKYVSHAIEILKEILEKSKLDKNKDDFIKEN